MNSTDDKITYDHLRIHALPPRKNGRDRRRLLTKAMNISDENKHTEIDTTTETDVIIDDAFSPLVEEFAHVRIPDSIVYDDNRLVQYEFLDNTADIQVHSWGKTLSEAFEQCVLGMFGYMTDLESVHINVEQTPIVIKARGHDCLSLLYDILNECLCSFHTMDMLIKDIRIITELDGKDFSSVRLLGFGEKYNNRKHPQGTEIKAITYSNMQVHIKEEKTDVYVILDIYNVS